jgi:hypothetical protein
MAHMGKGILKHRVSETGLHLNSVGNVRPGTEPDIWRFRSASNIRRHAADEVP